MPLLCVSVVKSPSNLNQPSRTNPNACDARATQDVLCPATTDFDETKDESFVLDNARDARARFCFKEAYLCVYLLKSSELVHLVTFSFRCFHLFRKKNNQLYTLLKTKLLFSTFELSIFSKCIGYSKLFGVFPCFFNTIFSCKLFITRLPLFIVYYNLLSI